MIKVKSIKKQENDKIGKKIGKNTIFNKKTFERSSDKPGNYPICMLWQRYRFGLDFRI